MRLRSWWTPPSLPRTPPAHRARTRSPPQHLWSCLQQDFVVSDLLLDLEGKLMVISDMKIFNELFLDMDVEFKRLRHEKSYKKRKIVRMHRTEFMKRSDNLRRRLRRCYLKILDLKSNNREKYILKRIQLSLEYEEVSRKVILEQQG